MIVKIKKISDKAIIPTKNTKYAASYDLYACTRALTVIPPHQEVKIKTGLAIELPHGYFGGIVARDVMATKLGLRIRQGMAIIDEDYRGEIVVSLHNDTDIPQTINPMEHIAQLIVMPYLPLDFHEVDELSETGR
ncbi:MAG: dUTP diphosphatase [Alphaproteobacteria bacterium]|nr:dUTP diphosphatase [Alphaproteobacteria bacterium]MBQ6886312.1 dUTP diphosphatase [Lachnospiraceae bacterium]